MRQAQSTGYRSTTTVILTSELKHHDDTTGVSISYRYTVNGQPFTSDRYTFNAGSSSDSAWAHQCLGLWFTGAGEFFGPSQKEAVPFGPGFLVKTQTRRGDALCFYQPPHD